MTEMESSARAGMAKEIGLMVRPTMGHGAGGRVQTVTAVIGAALVVAATVLVPLGPVASALGRPATGPVPGSSSGPLVPTQDPFYTYSGTTPLADIAPGTVLNTRSIDLAAGTTSVPVSAEQLLYRTTGELGQPTVTVTTVIAPLGTVSPPRLVGYLSFYDALGSECDPSYTLQ